MKIALFSDTFAPQINGVTNTLGKLIKYYEENDIEYIVFAPKYDNRNKDINTERIFSVKLFLYPECRIALPNFFKISKKIDEFKPDIIHIMTEFSMGIAGRHYGKKYSIPTISNYTTNFAQYVEYYKLGFLRQKIWNYMKWFHNQNIITLSPSNEAQKLLNRNGIHKTDIFSRGIDTQKFSPDFRSDNLRKHLGVEQKTVFLYVGRVSLEKNLDVLCRSYKDIKGKYRDDVALIITGDGPYIEKCKEMFPDDTIFTGFKKGHDLSEIYASSDVFVCPSSTETFGNVILEAMASGLAVIGADAGGIKETIEHRQNGLKFEAGNDKLLIDCMAELIENKILKNYIITNGVEFSKNRSWDNIIGGLMNIYEHVLDKRN